MQVLSLRETPELQGAAAQFITDNMGTSAHIRMYANSAGSCADSPELLPQWFVLADGAGKIKGCAGLIERDYLSRGDLSPWLCALHTETSREAKLLIDEIKWFARGMGCGMLYAAIMPGAQDEWEPFGFGKLCGATTPTGEQRTVMQYALSSLPAERSKGMSLGGDDNPFSPFVKERPIDPRFLPKRDKLFKRLRSFKGFNQPW